MALSLSRPPVAAKTTAPLAATTRLRMSSVLAHSNKNSNSGSGLSSMMDSVGAALTRVVFSPPSRDNASVQTGAGGFSGKLPARHGAARRPFASPGPMAGGSNKNKMPPAAAAASPMSSVEEEERMMGGRGRGRGGGGGGGGPAAYLSGALGRVFGGQAGMGDHDGPPTTGAIGWSGEAASRRHSQRRRGIGGGF